MAITNIDVGAAPNDGQGDPLRTAFQITNSNFDQLNDRAQTTPPTTLLGKVGDQAGYYAYDSTYFYYCFANYTGNTNIWAQVTQVANISTNQITSGNSNVIISGAGGNVVVGVNGVANVAVISSTSANMIGNVVAGGFFLGNGSFLTGLPQTYANANVQAYAESGWAGNIIPAANVAYDLGSPSRQFKDLYLSNSSLYLGNVQLTATGTELLVNGNTVITTNAPITGNISVTGNITGANLNATTNLTVSNTGYIYNISSTGLSSLTTVTATTVSATGNVTGGNILTSGLVSATGNVSGGNAILTGNLFSNTNPTVTYSGGTASLNANTYAQLYWTSNIANINPVIGNDAYVWAYVNGNGFTVSSNASAGFEWNNANNEVIISGNVVANGNVTASSFSTFGNLSIDDNASAGNSKVKQIGAASSLTVGYEEDPVGGGNVAYVTFNDPFAPGSTIQFWTGNNLATNTWTIEANGDFGGPGNISILEDFSGTNASLTGNVSMDGDLSITGNVISEANFSGNLTVADTVTAANLVAFYANINTSEGLDVYGGDIRVTENLGQGGNVTANTINTFDLSLAGNITSDANISGNLTVAADVVAANISASGNVVASYANINTSAGLDVYAGDIRVTADLGTGGNVTANYFIGDGSQLTNLPGGGAGLPLANGTSNINIATANGNVTVTSAGNTWNFVTDGSLTLPIGVSIDSSVGPLYPKIIADSGKLFSVQGQGNTGSAALAWTVDPNAASQYAAVAVTRAGGDNLAKVVLQAQSDSGNAATAKTWRFDETGNVTLPGNTFAVNYANGTPVSISGGGGLPLANGTSNFDIATANGNVTITANAETYTFGTNGNLTAPGNISATGNVTGNYILGNGSQLTNLPAPTVAQDIASVGAMSIMLYDGNIKYNNYATVEPSSGNITGGNILTGGLISAAGNVTAGNVSTGIITLTNGAVIKDTANEAVAFGQGAGQASQGSYAVAIGANAGNTSQGAYAVAIGVDAGKTNQGINSVAVGINAGNTSQGIYATAVGAFAGYENQGNTAVAIGQNTGVYTQGEHAVAVGLQAGFSSQGISAIAIGHLAGYTSQGNNSIILNATGANLNQTTANTFTVAPVRNDVANVDQVMFYNATSKEITYGNVISVAGNITGGNILTGGLVSATGNITGNYILGNGSQLTSINAVTVDITDTNGLTTVYYPTFVENRANAQIARADVDLTYRTDDNLLTVGNVSVTGNITGNTDGFAIGYRDIPQVSFTANATIAATDAGKHYYSTLSTANALTIANNTSVSWTVGTAITVVNRGTGNIIITQGSGVSLYLAGNSTPANRTVTTYGMATLLNVAANVWMINGTGVS